MCQKLDSLDCRTPELIHATVDQKVNEKVLDSKVKDASLTRFNHSDSEITTQSSASRFADIKPITIKKDPCSFCKFFKKKPIQTGSQILIPVSTKENYTLQIDRIEDETLKSQLKDLHYLCNIKLFNDHNTFKKIMEFALAQSQNENKIVQAKRVIGMLIYLTDHDSHFLNSLLVNKEDAVKKIQLQFHEKLKEIDDHLIQIKKMHEETELQDPERAYSTLLPIELAKILISDTGHVNIGIISTIIKKFCKQKDDHPYQRNLVFVLKALKICPILRKRIAHFTLPRHNNPSTDIIRISLGYSPSQNLTQNDAKKAALAALLSHMRQGPANSCFASFLAIGMLSTCLNQCLKDFRNVLEKGFLTRMVNGKPVMFPFILKTSTESAAKTIKITRQGKLINSSDNEKLIWEAPGIAAACKAIGLAKPKAALQKCLSDLFFNHNDADKVEISVTKLFKQIIISMGLSKHGDIILNKALLAFESQFHNPLLRIWENVIAGMAEADMGGVIKSGFIRSILFPISKQLENNPAVQKKFIEELTKQISDVAKYQYDPDIKSSQVARDGRSYRGAFVLYDSLGISDSSNWKRIDNSSKFIKFIYKTVKDVCQIVLPDDEETSSKLGQFILSNEFIISCLENYDPSLINDKTFLQELDKLLHTPWLDKTGNNSKEVIKVYFEIINELQTKELKPVDAKELLKSLIQLSKKFPQTYKEQLLNNSYKHTPVLLNSIHAFSLMLGHPSFLKAWESDELPEQWINQSLIEPASVVANSLISEGGRQKIIVMAGANVIPQGHLKLFKEKLKEIPDEISILEFRKQLLRIIKELVPPGLPSMNTIKEGLDSSIYKYVLTDEQRAVIQRTAIHFADTNWGESIHDIHFCFVVNPGTGQLELWEGLENGQNLYPLHQSEWLQKQQWELFPHFWKSEVCN